MRPGISRSRLRHLAGWLGLILLLSACESASPPPSPDSVGPAYAAAWQRGDVRAMWALVSPAAQAEVGEPGFIDRLPRIAKEMTLTSLEATAGPVSRPAGSDGMTDPRRAQVPIAVTWHTSRVGDVRREVSLDLILVGEGPQAEWRIAWTAEAILPRLVAGRLVRMTRVPTSRGRILARDGSELATFGDAAVIGVVPGLMRDQARTLASIGALGIPESEVRTKLAQPWVTPETFVPIRTIHDITADARVKFGLVEGVQVKAQRVRAYPTSLASQTLGYLGEASAQDAAKGAARGVAAGDLVGKAGLEGTLDDALGGSYGWRLSIVESTEAPVEVLGERAAIPGQDAVLALDLVLQRAAEVALGDQKGAIVAEDPATGEILALASRPSFDLNVFVRGDTAAIQRLNTDPLRPLLNRATFGQYTAGSTFKPITSAAAFRAGLFKAGDRLDCPYRWTGYGPSFVQVNHETVDLGPIDLRTALARSCNTFYYELGKRLNDKDPNLLPAAARSFGLGQATDIDFVLEAEGIVPSPAWKLQRFASSPAERGWNPGDATNLAIGQGFLTVTPLQMANYVTAIANDGVVWKPRLVIALQDRAGATTRRFERAELGRALTTPADLAQIRAGLRAVVADPVGTVYFPFRTFATPVAGKSGTAEAGAAPNAWFIGWGPYERPTLSLAVVYEEKPGLLGSQDAAVAARAVFGARFGSP